MTLGRFMVQICFNSNVKLYLLIILPWARCQQQGLTMISNILNGVAMMGRLDGAIQHVRQVGESQSPNNYVPYKPEASACDPNIHGTCCLFPNYCHPAATCKASKVQDDNERITPGFMSCSLTPILSVLSSRCPFALATRATRAMDSRKERGAKVRSAPAAEVYCGADVDECLTREALCNQICEVSFGPLTIPGMSQCAETSQITYHKDVGRLSQDTTPGYLCKCYEGYRLSSNGFLCEDIDECKEETAPCTQQCTNTPGSYTCGCRPGFELGPDKATCHDIDECALMRPNATQPQGLIKPCQYIDLCQNFHGSYSCGCPLGYKVDMNDLTGCVDVDECQEGVLDELNQTGKVQLQKADPFVVYPTPVCKGSDAFPPQQQCYNTDGSFVCQCAKGFEQSISSSSGASLFSSPSSFGLHSTVSAMNEAYLSHLREEIALTCKDLDECASYVDVCGGNLGLRSDMATSQATIAAVVLDQMSQTMTELNESRASRESGSDPSEESSTRDSATSLAEIEDILWNTTLPQVEKLKSLKRSLQVSPTSATCVNTEGSFDCECPKGFKYNATLLACQFNSPCDNLLTNLCVANEGEVCIPDQEKYLCGCKAGFRPTTGNVTAYDPLQMIQRRGQLNTWETFCQDINECEEKTSKCHDICVNTKGGYTCGCRPGYASDPEDPTRCVDINECDYTMCPPQTRCINLPGSYLCSCQAQSVTELSDFTAMTFERAFARLDSNAQRLYKSLQSPALIGQQQPEGQKGSDLIDWSSQHWMNVKTTLSRAFHEAFQCKSENLCPLLTQYVPDYCEGHARCHLDAKQQSYGCDCSPGYQLSDNAGNDQGQFVHHLEVYQRVLLNLLQVTQNNQVPVRGQVALDVGIGLPTSFDLTEAQYYTEKSVMPFWLLTHFSWVGYLSSAVPCVDIDECSAPAGVCSPNEPCCYNTPGSYQCVSKLRYLLRATCPSQTVNMFP